MKSIIFGLIAISFAVSAHAEVKGSSSMTLEMPMSAKELKQHINSSRIFSNSFSRTDSRLGYGLGALGDSYEMDKAALVDSTRTAKDLEAPVLIK